MNRNWLIGICLTLLLIGGVALDVSAQQPSAPAPSAPAAPADKASPAPDSSTPGSAAQPAAPQMQPAPSTNTETRTEKTERIVERESGKFLGVNPTVAMILGAAVLIVIVFGLVAMSRRNDERVRTTHTHTRV